MVRSPWLVAGPLLAVLVLSGETFARPQKQATTTAVSSTSSTAPALPSASAEFIPEVGSVPIIDSVAANSGRNGNGTGKAGGKKAGPPSTPYGFTPFVYLPGFAIAAFGAVAYAIVGFITTYQFITVKAWFFMFPFQGALIGLAGMIARLHAVLHRDPNNMTSFIAQLMCSSMQPLMMTLAAMMTFTRFIWMVTPLEFMDRKYLGLPHHMISMIWIGLIALQDVAKTLAGNLGKPKKGEQPSPTAVTYRVQQIALCLQFFILLGWTIWSFVIMKMVKRWTKLDAAEDARARVIGWASVAVGGVITFRTLYMTMENDASFNPKSFISQHEWVYWLCAVTPMLISYAIFIIYYPGHYLAHELTRFKFDTKKLEKAERERIEQARSQESSLMQPVDTNIPDSKEIQVDSHALQVEDVSKKV